jgi:hypothetical protein
MAIITNRLRFNVFMNVRSTSGAPPVKTLALMRTEAPGRPIFELSQPSLHSSGPYLAVDAVMPEFSAPNFIAGLIFGSIGFVAFVYGKRMNLWRTMFAGLALMIYPYFIANTVLLFVVGMVGSVALFFLRE